MAANCEEIDTLVAPEDLQQQLQHFYQFHCKLHNHFYAAGLDKTKYFQTHFDKLEAIAYQLCNKHQAFDVAAFLTDLEEPIDLLKQWLKEYAHEKKTQRLNHRLINAKLRQWDFETLAKLQSEIELQQQGQECIETKCQAFESRIQGIENDLLTADLSSQPALKKKIVRLRTTIKLLKRGKQSGIAKMMALQLKLQQTQQRLSKQDSIPRNKLKQAITRFKITLKLIQTALAKFYDGPLTRTETRIYDLLLRCMRSRAGISQTRMADAYNIAQELVNTYAAIVRLVNNLTPVASNKKTSATTRLIFEKLSTTVNGRPRTGSLLRRHGSMTEIIEEALKSTESLEDCYHSSASDDDTYESDTEQACDTMGEIPISTSSSKSSVESSPNTLAGDIDNAAAIRPKMQ